MLGFIPVIEGHLPEILLVDLLWDSCKINFHLCSFRVIPNLDPPDLQNLLNLQSLSQWTHLMQVSSREQVCLDLEDWSRVFWMTKGVTPSQGGSNAEQALRSLGKSRLLCQEGHPTQNWSQRKPVNRNRDLTSCHGNQLSSGSKNESVFR